MSETQLPDPLPPETRAALERYLVEHDILAPGARLSAAALLGGRSNLTYGLTDGEHEWVLRTPPRHGVAPTAHDIAREHRTMHALASSSVPVPKMLALCEDRAVLGVPFVLMERVPGQVWRAPADASGASPAARRRACEALVDALAAVHEVQAEDLGLPARRDADRYLERQVERWGNQWLRWKSREVPEVEILRDMLLERLPRSSRPRLVHGDYRFDNVVLDEDCVGKLRAVLDWELSTIGDPFADVGSLVAFWGDPNHDPVLPHQELTQLDGFLSAAEIVERYEWRTGNLVEDLWAYVAFGCFRWAVIREGILARSRVNGLDSGLQEVAGSVQIIAARGIAGLSEGPAA